MCSQCGQTHAELLTDFGFKLPDVVWAIPEEERRQRAHFDSDLCTFDGRYFVRCILRVPFTERAGYFGWGVWVEVSRDDFARYLERYRDDAADEPAKPGILANRIASYADAAGEAVEIRFGSAADRPAVIMNASSTSSLAREQRDGIDDERYHAILVNERKL